MAKVKTACATRRRRDDLFVSYAESANYSPSMSKVQTVFELPGGWEG